MTAFVAAAPNSTYILNERTKGLPEVSLPGCYGSSILCSAVADKLLPALSSLPPLALAWPIGAVGRPLPDIRCRAKDLHRGELTATVHCSLQPIAHLLALPLAPLPSRRSTKA